MDPTSADRFSSLERSGGTIWVVVIEATAGPRAQPYELECVRQLLIRLSDWHATGLYCADRYAVQLEVEASRCSDALQVGMAVHNQASEDIAMTPPLFLRAEVLTPEVLQGEWEAQGVLAPKGAPAPGMVPSRVYDATRAVLHAASATEIRNVLADFVADNGGSIAVGGRRPATPGRVGADMGPGPEMGLGPDMGLGADENLYVSVEALSVGGMLIEQYLPQLVADARLAFQRCRRQPNPR
jgi:hypothetical protein